MRSNILVNIWQGCQPDGLLGHSSIVIFSPGNIVEVVPAEVANVGGTGRSERIYVMTHESQMLARQAVRQIVKKTQNLSQETDLTRDWIQSLLDERQWCYPSTTAVINGGINDSLNG